METLPLVSIITPSFNQAAFLEDTIQSVLQQDYPNLEHIIMDGGSADGSVEILRRYADKLAYWESQPDRGQSHAINKGLQRARGEFLTWLNSDDRLCPHTTSLVVETFRAHPEVDVIYGRLERIDADGHSVPTPGLPKDRVVMSKETALGDAIVNQAGCFWRRSLMEKAGWLNEDLHYAMDYEYWIRMLLAGGRFMRLTEVVAEFRLSRGSKTVGQTARMAYEGLSVLNAFARQAGLPEKLGLPASAVRRQVRQGRSVACLLAFYGLLKERSYTQALPWLGKALLYDPLVLFQPRWLGLGWAGMRRRRSKIVVR